MSSKLKLLVISFSVILTFFVGGIGLGYILFHPKAKKDTIAITTTVDKAKAPQPTRTIPQGYVSVPVSDELPPPDEQILPENKILIFPPKDCNDSTHLPIDTLKAYVPIHQKEYRDSNYTAYVSGFNAKLDSIEIKTKVVTYTKSVTKFRTWNIGLTGGYGYGFMSKQFEPFVGIGITLNLFR